MTFLLKKGEEAGASKVHSVTQQAEVRPVENIPLRPQSISARVENFQDEGITLTPIRSWGADVKRCIVLSASAKRALSQPGARITLARPTTAPVVLEIQYTIAQAIVELLQGNSALRDKTDGVTLLVSTVGAGFSESSLLKLDPVRNAGECKWLSYPMILPRATKEVHFSIIGPPPAYNVFWDSCALFLPQLRVIPSKTPTPAAQTPTPST